MRILLALIALPLIEITLFVQTGRWLGLWPVLGLVVMSALAGGLVLARGRYSTLRNLQAAMEQERDPAAPLGHAALRMLGGVMLVVPGFFSDALGLLLMLPGVRALMLRRMMAGVHVVHSGAAARRGPRPGGDVVEGDYEVHPPRDDSPWRELPPDRPENRH